MRVAITGHTSGIGAAIAEILSQRGDEVLGFSRSNGYDISDCRKIVGEIAQCDALINNAHAGFAQVDLLHAAFTAWERWPQRRTIITIGSKASDTLNRVHPYATEKAAIEHACQQLSGLGRTRICLVRPGYVDTPRVENISAPKLDPVAVAKTVCWVLDQPPDVVVESITLNAHKSMR